MDEIKELDAKRTQLFEEDRTAYIDAIIEINNRMADICRERIEMLEQYLSEFGTD